MPELPTGTVTFLFTDLEGSTRLWEAQPAAMRAAVDRHLALLRAAVDAHRGHIFRTVGDGLCAAFATAPDAVASALLAQRELVARDWGETGPLRARMALHTGAVEVRGGDYVGACLNRLGRLLAAGHGGQVLLSQATADLARETLPAAASLRDLGEQRLRDLGQAEHVYQLLHPDLPADFPPLKSLDASRHNLPLQLTSFVGRERELAAVKQALEQTRLLTLTGPGGTGKTRLALEATQRMADRFPDGIWFVSLASLTDPTLVTEAVAHVLGVQERAGVSLLSSLVTYLRSRRLLVLLDNCEHLLPAVSLVGELLGAAPGLTVLATSRVPLRLSGERLFAVSPLRLPGDDVALAATPLAQYDAVRLFIERAQAVKADFLVTNANAPTVAELCHRLDGLPLAIELAAARVRLLSPQALLERLTGQRSPLQLLSEGPRNVPRRQQTLRNTIAWSYDLLQPEEQRLFDRMGVFAGGATLEAIEAVANAEGDLGLDIFEGVDALTTSNLVRAEGPEGAPRFGMLVTVRDFARERLVAEGAWEELRRRHAEYYVALAERLAPRLHSAARWGALEELDVEQDNLRAALGWAVGTLTSAEPALRLAAALRWFWYWRSQLSEALGWMKAALARAVPRPATVAWATARYDAGVFSWMLGDLPSARAGLEEGIALLRELGDQRLAEALTVLGAVAAQQGHAREGQRYCEEALALARSARDRWWEGATLAILGDATLLAGDLDQAEANYMQGLALFEGMGDRWGLGLTRKALGGLAAVRGDYAAARDLYERAVADQRAVGHIRTMAYSLAGLGEAAARTVDLACASASYKEGLLHFRDFGLQGGVAVGLIGLADVALARGQHERAIRLLTSAPGHFKVVGVVLRPMPDSEFADRVGAARARMDEAAFSAAWAAGQAMSLEQAVAYALNDDIAPASATRTLP